MNLGLLFNDKGYQLDTNTMSESDEDNSICYPSGKLGALTRAQNELKTKLEEGIGKSLIRDLQSKIESKYSKWKEACDEELEKVVEPDEMKSFKKWIDASRKKYLITNKKIEVSLLKRNIGVKEENEDGEDDDDGDEEGEQEEEEEEEDDDDDDGSEDGEDGEDKKGNKTNELLQEIVKSQVINKLPTHEPPVFDGTDISSYRTFKLSFMRIIEREEVCDADRYFYLLKYTAGEAYTLVNSCYSKNATKALDSAKKALDSQYGNEFLQAQEILRKLRDWRPIKSENPNELARFAAYLMSCLNMMEDMTSLNQLNSWRDIREIVLILPYDLRKKFRAIAQQNTERGRPTKFKDVAEFVNKHSRMANLPVLGDISDRNRVRPNIEKPKQRALYATDEQQKYKVSCECCKKNNHVMDNCKFFLQKSLQERTEFVKNKDLCFGCLSKGHQSKHCNKRLKCKQCDGLHPSSLHREFRSKRNDYSRGNSRNGNSRNDNLRDDNSDKGSSKDFNLTARTKGKIVCPAIPVVVRNTVNNECTTTYAALDNHSTSCYMDTNLMKQLKLRGEKKNVNVTTIEGTTSCMDVKVVNDIELLSLDHANRVSIPWLYAKDNWPFDMNDSPKKEDVERVPLKEKVKFAFIDKPIGILIGMNMPEILKPLKTVSSTKRGPYASCHSLGNALNGPISGNNATQKCFKMKVAEVEDLDNKFAKAFGEDFESLTDEIQPSADDKQWLDYMNANTTKLHDNHFEAKLPFKCKPTNNCNNKQLLSRLNSLNRKLKGDSEMAAEYSKFMDTMVQNDFMEKVPNDELDKKDSYYLSHHGVVHKQKKKLRVVFDCSMKTQGESLNDYLWKGPNLANSLVGVLLRFRLEKFALTADIEKMFNQVRLSNEDKDYHRFMWYPNNDLNSEPSIYRMKVHIFGATSSPAVANFALKKSVENENSEQVRNIVENSFYVDDLMHSFSDETEAIKCAEQVKRTLAESGFNITKFCSNSRKILGSLSPEDLVDKLKSVPLGNDIPQQQALGIKWNPEDDTIGYDVDLPQYPATKRGILSTIASIYDPLFLASPAVIRGKRLFQICCDLKLGWDESIPAQYEYQWNKYRIEIAQLNHFKLPRCYKSSCSDVKTAELHLFADGSNIAYGAVAYLRHTYISDVISTSIVMAKSKLTPLNRTSLKTVPRIELNAAKLAVQLYETLNIELGEYMEIHSVKFWTDSRAVLQYLNSEKGQFKTHVANRISYIRSKTNINDWNHVPGQENPADLLSRGVSDVAAFIQDNKWLKGPSFLSKCQSEWPYKLQLEPVDEADPELKKKQYALKTTLIEDPNNSLNTLINSTSNLFKLKCRIATMIRLKKILLHEPYEKSKITISELKAAEIELFRIVQKTYFSDIIELIKNDREIPAKNYLKGFDLFMDSDGIIRVGGRLRRAPIPYDAKHPILLHGASNIVKLMTLECHKNIGHMGKETMLANLKQRFHIIAIGKLVKRITKSCVICKKVQGKAMTQMMADLPEKRTLNNLPPFTHTATDLFGPFYVKMGRGNKQVKRYGVIFSCLTTRAIHIEVAHSLDTNSYINSLRRFISRRGKPVSMLSDNGTNLCAADKELKSAMDDWNKKCLENYCQEQSIEWSFQPPHASHFGGVFERHIRTIRKILNSMLWEHSNKIKLTDDLLNTLLCEVENILNSRPLTAVSTDYQEILPLTPNSILRLAPLEMSPQGIFTEHDIHTTKSWRQAQYLADIFWHRYRKEYLPMLQKRNKWVSQKTNAKPGDIVIIMDHAAPRNDWCIGVIKHVKFSQDKLVRSCSVELLKNKYCKNNFKKTILERPISKLILLCDWSTNID